MKENAFYKYFSSFEALQSQLWVEVIEDTLDSLEKDSAYVAFSTREKWLAFLFSFFEMLKSERSLYIKIWPQRRSFFPEISSDKMKKRFLEQAEKWLDEGRDEGVIKEDWIPEVLKNETAWWHFFFLMEFWKKDDSVDFERTDIAIEKSVHLLFDAYGNDVGERIVDFAKFLAPDKANPLDIFNQMVSSLR